MLFIVITILILLYLLYSNYYFILFTCFLIIFINTVFTLNKYLYILIKIFFFTPLNYYYITHFYI